MNHTPSSHSALHQQRIASETIDILEETRASEDRRLTLAVLSLRSGRYASLYSAVIALGGQIKERSDRLSHGMAQSSAVIQMLFEVPVCGRIGQV